jgi:hypothetical protein
MNSNGCAGVYIRSTIFLEKLKKHTIIIVNRIIILSFHMSSFATSITCGNINPLS